MRQAIIPARCSLAGLLAGAAPALVAALVAASAAWGQCQEQKLYAVEVNQEDNRFGYAVALNGDVAVVGAYNAEAPTNVSGLAYVFRRQDLIWVEEQALFPWDAIIDSSLFGYSVAIGGDVIVVGTRHGYHEGLFSGSAYVYRYDGLQWTQEQKIVAADRAAEDDFGHDVAVAGDVIVIGARGDDDNGIDSGSAYVFRYDGTIWVQESKLLADDGAEGDRFGSAVAFDGQTIVIGARGGDDSGIDSGSVYVFTYEGSAWVQQQKLVPSDGAPQDQFGSAVDVSGDTVLIGAFRDDDGGRDAGAAYVFTVDGSSWVQTHKLLASDGAAVDQFGVSVALDGTTALVGARWDDDAGIGSGSAYLFHFDADAGAWMQAAKLLAGDGAPWDEFGVSVDVSGDRAIAGSWLDGDFGYDTGAAYVFSGVSGLDCNGNGTADACDIATGVSGDANGNGVPDECDCPWDLDGDGQVAVGDLLMLLAAWGTDPGGPPDFDGNGDVGVGDLLALLANLGPCPP